MISTGFTPARWSATPVVYKTRSDWLNARRSVIGASDTAGIFGVGYADQSAISVYESKVQDLPEEEEDSRLRYGSIMEPALRLIFGEETGLACESVGDLTIWRSHAEPWLGATLDGVVSHPEFGLCPVELKNVGMQERKNWQADECPLKFQVQVQHQLAVTGAKHAFLMGFIGGNEVAIRKIDRDGPFIAAMTKRLKEFWECVTERKIPKVDDSVATAQSLMRLHPDDNGKAIVLPSDAINWIEEREKAAEKIKEYGNIKREAENKIRAALGDATYGEVDGYCFSWKTTERAGHTVRPSKTRTLRVIRSLPKGVTVEKIQPHKGETDG